jgi:hypothetical protein
MLNKMKDHIARKRPQKEKAPPQQIIPRRTRAPRIAFPGKVLMVKNDRYLKGRSVNISNTGIFVETFEKVFEEQELVRLIIKPDGPRKTFKLIARVVRYNSYLNQLRGYGLEFVKPVKLVLRKK